MGRASGTDWSPLGRVAGGLGEAAGSVDQGRGLAAPSPAVWEPVGWVASAPVEWPWPEAALSRQPLSHGTLPLSGALGWGARCAQQLGISRLSKALCTARGSLPAPSSPAQGSDPAFSPSLAAQPWVASTSRLSKRQVVDPCGEEHSAGVSSESIQRLFNANTKSNLSRCKAGDCGLGVWHKVAHVSHWWLTGSMDQEKGACGSAAFPCHLVAPPNLSRSWPKAWPPLT